MKIGIISDSHDHWENIEKAIKIFQDQKTDFVIHLGDYVSGKTITRFQGIKLIGIFGNNDGDKVRLVNFSKEINAEIKGDFYEFEEDGLKFAAYHGTESGITEGLIYCGKYDVVLTGHTHIPGSKKAGETLAINPGTAHGFGGKATVAIFDMKNKAVEFFDL